MKFDWRILPHRLKIATLPNGKDHLLGCGAFGAVRLLPTPALAQASCLYDLDEAVLVQCWHPS